MTKAVFSTLKNNLIASSLAQEGLELIRQTRDLNWQHSQPFTTNLIDGSYSIDYRSSVPTSASATTLLYLKDGFYVHNNGSDTDLTPTIFSRQIIINKFDSYDSDPMQVRSIVSWVDHSHPYHYELQTLLFDWLGRN